MWDFESTMARNSSVRGAVAIALLAAGTLALRLDEHVRRVALRTASEPRTRDLRQLRELRLDVERQPPLHGRAWRHLHIYI